MEIISYPVIVLREEHLPSAAELEKLCFPAPWSTEQFRHAMEDAFTRLYGICIDGRVAAYLLCSVVGDYAEILNIATHPDYRRKGLANALLAFWLNMPDIRKLQIILEVRAKNTAAQNLYAKFGFRQIHIRKNYYQDDDALVMQRLGE